MSPNTTQGSRTGGLRFQVLVHRPSMTLDQSDQPPALFYLFLGVVHRRLQDDALGPSLSFYTRHDLGECIEAFADGLSSFLLCAFVSTFRVTRDGNKGLVPDAMWFFFFSSSVSRGFSSSPLAWFPFAPFATKAPSPGEEYSLGDCDVAIVITRGLIDVLIFAWGEG